MQRLEIWRSWYWVKSVTRLGKPQTLGVDVGLASAAACATEDGDLATLFEHYGPDIKDEVAATIAKLAADNGLTIALERLGKRREAGRKGPIFAIMKTMRNAVMTQAALHGVRVCFVRARYTSQRCAECGFTDARNRPERDIFACIKCGHIDHADLNAARNIARRAEMRGMGKSVVISRRVPGER